MLHRFTTCTVTLALSITGTAHAESQPAGADLDHYEWRFDDDALHGSGSSPYGEWLKVRPHAPRVMLIRPRASFVMELLSSIGKL